MRSIHKTLLLIGLFLSALASASGASSVEIRNGDFYVNGEKFFVKGIGHELGSRPGEIPWERKFKPEFLKFDLALINAGGFNTMRTWNSLTEQELEIIAESGLMVIQGFWFEVDKYINEPKYAAEIEGKLRVVIAYSKKFDNILFYTINNEPEPWIVVKNGIGKVNEAFRKMKAVVKEIDPGRAVSVSVAHWNECIDQTIWDVQFHNFYIYGPITNVVMGYKEHLEWFKRAYAKGIPFVVGEFGLSVSKNGSKDKYGYGGNSLEDQKNGDLLMYEDIIAAGLQGGCLFMWNDGWWKAGLEKKHDDHAEEWYGVLGIEDENSDPRGIPRPVYYAFKEYNQAILTSPRNLKLYSGSIPVEVYVTSSVTSVSFRLDDGKWQKLAKNGRFWFTGEIDCSLSPEGRKTLEIKVVVKGLNKPVQRRIIIWTGKSELSEPVLSLETVKDVYTSGEEITFEMKFVKGDGSPVEGKIVKYAFHSLLNGLEKQYTAITDAEGKASFKYTVFGKETYIKFVAAAELEKDGESLRYTAAKLVRVESPVNEEGLVMYGPMNGEMLYDFEYASGAEAVKDFETVYTGGASFKMNANPERKHKGISSLNISYIPAMAGSWGYTQNTFKTIKDLSGYMAAGIWVYGDSSSNFIKIMLRDEDGERWYDSEMRITWSGWRKVIFALATLQRDPYDQVADGNNKPDLDKVTGLSLVMTSGGQNQTNIDLDQLELYK